MQRWACQPEMHIPIRLRMPVEWSTRCCAAAGDMALIDWSNCNGGRAANEELARISHPLEALCRKLAAEELAAWL
jgi:hypothetical protein